MTSHGAIRGSAEEDGPREGGLTDGAQLAMIQTD
jgi:hypothetical protein